MSFSLTKTSSELEGYNQQVVEQPSALAARISGTTDIQTSRCVGRSPSHVRSLGGVGGVVQLGTGGLKEPVVSRATRHLMPAQRICGNLKRAPHTDLSQGENFMHHVSNM